MGAAREAGLYGIPAIANSYTSFDPEGMEVELMQLSNLFNGFFLWYPKHQKTSADPTSTHMLSMFLLAKYDT